jgi:hypothetical protein
MSHLRLAVRPTLACLVRFTLSSQPAVARASRPRWCFLTCLLRALASTAA